MPPKKPAKKSAKAIEKEQRDAVKTQLATIESNMRAAGCRHVLDSLFDAAIGLELWVKRNSKAFPAAAVTQKVERLGEIATLACDDKLDAEHAYWELAGLYTIVHRESSRKELNLEAPSFIFPPLPLPSMPADDVLTVEDIEAAIGCAIKDIAAKLAEIAREEAEAA
jgi:hypothetical protein